MNIGARAEEQWNRVQRYFARFEELSKKGRPHDSPSDMYVDDAYAFFINCYHLKDWLQNDPSSPLQDAARRFGRGSASFQICRDLCLGAKHLQGSDPKSTLIDTRLGRKHVEFNVSSNILKMRIFLKTASGEQEAFSVAEECMREWREFLSC